MAQPYSGLLLEKIVSDNKGMRLSAVTLLLFLVCSAVTRADDCQPIELDKGEGSMSRVSVLDQDGLNDCQSYAAAAMIDAWRFSHGDRRYDQKTSPLGTTLIANTFLAAHDPENKRFGGHTCEVVNSAREIGACTQNNVVEQIEYLRPDASIDALMKPFNDAMSRRTLYQKYIGELSKQNSGQAARDVECLMRSSGVARSLIPTLQVVDAAIKSASSREYLKSVLASRCSSENLIKIKSPTCNRSLTFGTGGLRMAKVNKLLDKPNPQPVGIYYCSNLLLEGRKYNSPLFQGRFSSSCEFHASVIIGRRRNNQGRCEMKIRNSWGTSCGYYSSDWDCDNGDIWVDAEKLTGSLMDINYIE